jgi:hypothetical protein
VHFGAARKAEIVGNGGVAEGHPPKNIACNSKVSLTVKPPYSCWDEIHGLSMGGKAEPVTDPKEINRAGQLMLMKCRCRLQFRTRLPAGGKEIRTVGPAVKEKPFRRAI